MSTDSALLVIDVQVGLIEPSYRSTEVLDGFRTYDSKITVKKTNEVDF